MSSIIDKKHEKSDKFKGGKELGGSGSITHAGKIKAECGFFSLFQFSYFIRVALRTKDVPDSVLA